MLTIMCASQIDLSENNLTSFGRSMTGIKALAHGISVSRSLNVVDTRNNSIDGEAAKELAAAVLASSSMIKFGEVPIKELRADVLTTLDLKSKNLGPTEAIVLAGLLLVSRSLTQVHARLYSHAFFACLCSLLVSLRADRSL